MTRAEARQILHALDAAYRAVSGTARTNCPDGSPGPTIRSELSEARNILIAEIQNGAD
jgi:hypothetical protein